MDWYAYGPRPQCVQRLCLYMYACMHICMYAIAMRTAPGLHAFLASAYVYACMHVCILCICFRDCACLCVRVCVGVSGCMSLFCVCVCVCVCVCLPAVESIQKSTSKNLESSKRPENTFVRIKRGHLHLGNEQHRKKSALFAEG
jgi:hypothetical protein